MINLLPPTHKSDIKYARKNTLLLKYCLACLVVIVGIAIITLSGSMFMHENKESLNNQAEAARAQLASQKLDEIQKKAESISGNIKLTTDVLSRQILFSKLLRQIGAAMPVKTSLSDLKINKGESGVTLTAVAQDYTSASQVQVNLSDPKNEIFSQADLVSIDCDKTTQLSSYPCTVVLRALFGDNKQYLFISPQKGKS